MTPVLRVLAALSFLAAAPQAHPDNAEPWTALRSGGVVALVRHAATTGGAGDPPGFRLEDCATQRNLTERGREQARRLGEQLRAEGVSVSKVLSSQWCRCRETAALMGFGAAEVEPTFNNAFALSDRRDALSAGAREIIAAWNGPGVLLVVTHGANIRPLTGIDPGEGGVVVVAPDAAQSGKMRVVGRILPGS
jgi:phosphohistidine phosphatase SixA